MKNKKRMTVMALVLASAMFAACGNSMETEKTIETKEEPVVTEVTEEESAASETEEEDVATEETETSVESEEPTETESGESAPVREVDARMARFIEVIKGYGAEEMHVQYQDSSVPQSDGIEVSSITGWLTNQWEKEAIGVVMVSLRIIEEKETEEEQDAGAGNGASGLPEGFFQPMYWEFESAEAAASAFSGIPEGYSRAHGCEEVEVADTRQVYFIRPEDYFIYQLHEDTIYAVHCAEGNIERAGQLIEELTQY